jgi:hypothetical protein
MFLSRCWGRTKFSIQVCDTCVCFVTRAVFTVTSCQHLAQPPPLVCCPRILIQYIRSYPPYYRQFPHPQTEDAPCRGDRDPLIVGLDTSEMRKIFPLQTIEPQSLGQPVHSLASIDTLFIQFNFCVTAFLQASMFYFENIKATYFLLTLNFRILQKKIHLHINTYIFNYIYIKF